MLPADHPGPANHNRNWPRELANQVLRLGIRKLGCGRGIGHGVGLEIHEEKRP